MSVTTYTSGSGNWVADATTATVECWGGGAGGNNGGSVFGGSSGGGGGYAIKTVTGLIIGNSYPYAVGAGGGIGASGGDSTFGSIPDCLGRGGSITAGGTGTGDATYTGGNGTTTGGGGGCGGGSSAGIGANGNNGAAGGGSGGAGGAAPTGGGAGGRGGDPGSNAGIAAGSAPGGGGGGGAAPSLAGAVGAAGQVRITTVEPDPISLSVPSLAMPTKVVPARASYTLSISLPTLSAASMNVSGLLAGVNISLDIPTLKVPVSQSPISFSYPSIVRLPKLTIVPKLSSQSIFADIAINLPCSILRAIANRVTISRPYSIGLPVLNLHLASHAANPGFIVPSLAKYVEVQKSSSGIIFGGVAGIGGSDQPFKLNVSAAAQKRIGRSLIVHTGKVKPEICTVEAEFEMLTGGLNLAPGEFRYTRLDGYLTITNLDAVTQSLVQDGDTFSILVSSQDIPFSPLLVTIDR